MTRLYLHGMGTCAMGFDRPFAAGLAGFDEIPVKDYAKASQRRRFGRLAKLVYVAAARAIENAGVSDPSKLVIVHATAMGETTVSLEILTQIHESRGAALRPSLVPNSVHNSPAGYLAIGLENHEPSITVSQGWLCGEAGLAAAADLLRLDASKTALVVAGDEVDPAWIQSLQSAGAPEWAARLASEHLQEGAIALILGTRPGDRDLGSLAADTVRMEPSAAGLGALLERHGVRLGPAAEIRMRAGACSAELQGALASALGRSPNPPHLDGPGWGTSQAGAFAVLAHRLQDPTCEELLLVGAEVDEIAFVHWVR